MKKYIGLIILVAMAASSFLAVKAAPDGQNSSRIGSGANDVQISQLDKRLNDRIVEQQELLQMVERLLGMNFQPKPQNTNQASGLLSGVAQPSVPNATAGKAKPAEKVIEPPWWLDYKPQMVYVSVSERYAVVNGKMYVTGQTLGSDVHLDKIEDDIVVLRQGTEHHTYFLKK
jgi:hypothetical protein